MEKYLMALQVDSKYAPAYNSIGTLMRSQGKLDEGRKTFRKQFNMMDHINKQKII